MEAEKVCLQSTSHVIIIRITLQYGWGYGSHTSFTDWLMNSLKRGQHVTLFSDQYRTPTYIIDTCKGIEIAALQAPNKEIYHLCGPERMNRYEFGLLFASLFKFPHTLIKTAPMQNMPLPAPRPKDVSLNGQKFFDHFKYKPRGVREGLEAMLCPYQKA